MTALVRRVPLYGIPCASCGWPAVAMDLLPGGVVEVHHTPTVVAGVLTRQRVCWPNTNARTFGAQDTRRAA